MRSCFCSISSLTLFTSPFSAASIKGVEPSPPICLRASLHRRTFESAWLLVSNISMTNFLYSSSSRNFSGVMLDCLSSTFSHSSTIPSTIQDKIFSFPALLLLANGSAFSNAFLSSVTCASSIFTSLTRNSKPEMCITFFCSRSCSTVMVFTLLFIRTGII